MRRPKGVAPPSWSDVEPVFLPNVSARVSWIVPGFHSMCWSKKFSAPRSRCRTIGCWRAPRDTTFLNCVNGLFVDRAGLDELGKVYARFIDQRPDFREVAHQAKLLILRAAMSSELQLLAHRLNRISERYRRSRDFTLNTLRVALREILACFPVYRTYIVEGNVSERDRQFIGRAVAQAKRRNPAIDAAVFDFIRGVLLRESPPEMDEAGRRERELFVGRFQQVTSPVMAKGIEDTAFYRYFPLASLNEVGGDPLRGATTIEEFHRQNVARQAQWPRSLVSTTTHDTKRSEDVRARISVLAEIPRAWRKAVNRWARLNRRHRREVDGQPAPSRNDEYLFYQTLVGIWPLVSPAGKDLVGLADRLRAYMEKATHEAKVHTSWVNPDSEYDAAVREFVSAALAEHPKNRFLAEFDRFHQQVVNWGLYNALGQTLLKLVSPGVPDIYQGQELWDFSLVDPDNRRPVDFAGRRKMLARLQKDIGRGERSLPALARQLAENPSDPRLKLFLTWRALQFRRRHADLFRLGEYLPLAAQGSRAKHVCAFARRWPSGGGSSTVTPSQGSSTATPSQGVSTAIPSQIATSSGAVAIAIVPRLIAQLTPLPPDSLVAPSPLGEPVWQDTYLLLGPLASSRLKNVLTGQIHSASELLRLADVLSCFPVALLSNVEGE